MEDVRIEYKKSPKKGSVAMTMMVKNEKKRLQVSLDSLIDKNGKPIVDAFIIFDTGSTDETVEIIKTHCEKHKINLYLRSGTFVNFCISRNVLHDFADTVPVQFLLLMDCNDELRGHTEFRAFIRYAQDISATGFMMCQQWFHGSVDEYFNIRLVKNNTGWRYKGSVHEHIANSSSTEDTDKCVCKTPNDFYLYQDRNQDDDKTGKRFPRDKELLIQELETTPKDSLAHSRALFYLGQTYSCLNNFKEAYECNRMRYELAGYTEERYLACVRCATHNLQIGGKWDLSLLWCIKALEIHERIEAFTIMIEHYINIKNWRMAYFFSSKAVNLPPTDCNLFVNKLGYDYIRWHHHGIICYNFASEHQGKFYRRKRENGEYEDVNKENELLKEGLEVCKIAILAQEKHPSIANANIIVDKENMKLYLNKLYHPASGRVTLRSAEYPSKSTSSTGSTSHNTTTLKGK